MRDMQKQRENQRKWLAKRRGEWLSKNGPCVRCGSSERLHVDHINPKDKVCHRVWSWTKERRNLELAKCQVLCMRCHQKKTVEDNGHGGHGVSRYQKGCRCRVCTDAKVKSVNEYRWKKGLRVRRDSPPATEGILLCQESLNH